MKNRSRWALWGTLGVVGILAIALLVWVWMPRRERLPDDAWVISGDTASLQDALTRVGPGGTIAIHAAKDPIQGPIVVDVPGITLIGIDEAVTLIGTGPGPAISLRAEGITLRHLAIRAEDIGLSVLATDCVAEDLLVESQRVGIQLTAAARCALRSIEVRGGTLGVELVDTGRASIKDLTVVGAADYGIRLFGSSSNDLQALRIRESAIGVSVESASAGNLIREGSIDACSIAAIEVRGSNDNLIDGLAIATTQIGVLLDGVTGTQIRGCTIRGAKVSGVSLQRAIQNRVLETIIEDGQGTGIHLAQSTENNLSYNMVTDCQDTGILLVSGSRNLVMGNEVDGCLVGIRLERSTQSRVLRNDVSASELCGFLITQGQGSRFLDNSVTESPFGWVLSETRGNALLRNTISKANHAGMLLTGTQGENILSDNDISGCMWGLALDFSTKDAITHNQLTDNDVGVLLSNLGGGVRVEGNALTHNDIGLLYQAIPTGFAEELASIGITLSKDDGATIPILTNNTFAHNSAWDIRSDVDVTLMAAGNWWGDPSQRDAAVAAISGDVSLESSAWIGTIAVGAGSDGVSMLLGRILQLTLSEQGFHVIDLVGLGPTHIVQQALLDEDVDLIWCCTMDEPGVVSIDTIPSVLIPTSAVEGWRVVVSTQLAAELAEPSISGLAAWAAETRGSFQVTTVSTFDEEAFEVLITAYDLNESIESLTRAKTLDEVEALLKFGAVDVVIVESLKETLTLSGFLAIEDDLGVLEQSPISMVLQQRLVDEYPEIGRVLEALGRRLTSEQLHDLMTRIRTLRKDSDDVAQEFVKQGKDNGD